VSQNEPIDAVVVCDDREFVLLAGAHRVGSILGGGIGDFWVVCFGLFAVKL
jgi:hypothetical protein